MNFKLTLQYDGTDFHGWQAQGELRTVQRELARALLFVGGSRCRDPRIREDGRRCMLKDRCITCSCNEFTPEKLRAAINGNLDSDVRVLEARIADDEFHARYSPEKTHIYRI
jgi:tRNA pseudouridine38-40 synthase